MLSFQSYLTLCDAMDCSLPGSSVHGILQARILEWVLQGFFQTQGSNLNILSLLHWQVVSLPLVPPGKPLYLTTRHFSRVRLCATVWSVACQVPLFMRFSRQEYWSGLPFPSPGDLPDPGIELMSPILAGGFFTTEPPGKPLGYYAQWEKKKSQKDKNWMISLIWSIQSNQIHRNRK